MVLDTLIVKGFPELARGVHAVAARRVRFEDIAQVLLRSDLTDHLADVEPATAGTSRCLARGDIEIRVDDQRVLLPMAA